MGKRTKMNKVNRMKYLFFILLSISTFGSISYGENTVANSFVPKIPLTQTISPIILQQFEQNSLPTQTLIKKALLLAGEQLYYKYGSDNPKNGGMDCSGTIHYLFTSMKIKKVPRQANTLYRWTWKRGRFYAVNSHHLNSFEFQYLKPGDLLFWSGTYSVNREPPITHVMLYLGKTKQGTPLMFGASNGRTYQGRAINGVSVFDFKLPNSQSHARFLGYSCIPSFNCTS